MLNFIIQYWLYIAVVLFVVGYVAYLIITKNWPGLRLFAYAIMLQLERIYLDNEGEKKFSELYKAVCAKFPLLIFVFKEDAIKSKLQKLYETAKDFLDNSKIDGSIYSDSPPPGRTR